jgi:hypothetical protein
MQEEVKLIIDIIPLSNESTSLEVTLCYDTIHNVIHWLQTSEHVKYDSSRHTLQYYDEDFGIFINLEESTTTVLPEMHLVIKEKKDAKTSLVTTDSAPMSIHELKTKIDTYLTSKNYQLTETEQVEYNELLGVYDRYYTNLALVNKHEKYLLK